MVYEKGVKLFDGEKPKYKDLTAMGEAKAAGIFILTNKRIIFVPSRSLTESIFEPLAYLLNEGLIKDMLDLATETSAGKGDVNLEELDVQKRPSFLEIPLNSIKKAEARKAYLFTNYLMIKYEIVGKERSYSFLFGQAARSKKELAKKIMEAAKASTGQ